MFKEFKTILYTLPFIYFMGLSTTSAQNDVIYYSEKFEICKQKDAHFYREVYLYDSLTLLVKDYYIDGNQRAVGYTDSFPESWIYPKEGVYQSYYTNGNLKTYGMYKGNLQVGPFKEYLESGQLSKFSRYRGLENEEPMVWEVYSPVGQKLVDKGNGNSREFNSKIHIYEEGRYENGQRTGTWKGFTETGRLCYEEQYTDGQFLGGISYHEDGIELPYTQVNQPAYFTNGIQAMYDYLSENSVYPKELENRSIGGKAIVRFTIDKEGDVSEVMILQSDHAFFSQAAKRVVKSMSGKWTPGLSHGQPVKYFFTMPIVFQESY